MRKIQELNFKNSIIRFMISYAGILLIPLLICLSSYQVSFNTVEEDIKENHLAMISHSQNIIDIQMEMIDSLVIEAVSNGTILSFSEYTKTGNRNFFKDGADATRTLDNIFRYANVDLLQDVYLYLNESDYILTRKELYEGKFYHKAILKEATSYEEWKKQLTDRDCYSQYVVTDKEIKYRRMYPFTMIGDAKGTITCVINKAELAELFNYIEVERGASLYIRDEAGNVLMSLTDEEELPDFDTLNSKEKVFSKKVNGKGSLIINSRSEKIGWNYVLILPEQVVMGRLISLRRQIAILFGCALFVGVVACYYMAQKNGKPMEEIKKNIGNSFSDLEVVPEEINNMYALSGTINKIVSTTQSLKEEIERQKPYLQVAFFQNLLKGKFTSEQEIQSVAQRAQIELNYSQYIVVIYKVFVNNDLHNLDEQTLEEVNLVDLLIRDYTKKIVTQNQTYFYNIDHLTTAIIIEQGETSYEVIKHKVECVSEKITKDCKIKPFWGMSSECNGVLEVWRSFEQAKSALRTSINREMNLVTQYTVATDEEEESYYPLVLEQRLMMYTKEADTESIKQLFDMLYNENFEKRKLNEESISKLFEQICGTIMKLSPNTKINEYFDEIKPFMYKRDADAAKKYFEKMTEIYLEMSAGFKQVKSNQQAKLINRIIGYINEVYMDSNLGLGMIATEFNISEGYISSLFKEQTGVNFTDYVEEQRIGKACELLQQTSLNINEISEKVGYNSVQSFRRAFKRSQGISPSEMRKAKTNEEAS